MKNSKILSAVIILFISATFFSSCKKYEDGPGISLRSKTARVSNHWKPSKAIWDGEDITADIDPFSMEFKTDNTYIIFDEDGTEDGKGSWAFDDKKETITTVDTADPSDKTIYTIKKLKEKEMILEVSDIGTVEITFEPK